MAKNIGRQVAEELLETGKSVKKQASQIGPKKVLQTAVDQVTGAKQESSKASALGDKGVRSVKPSSVSSRKITQLQLADSAKREEGLAQTRLKLQRMKMQRYQEMQGKISEEEKKKKQEIPTYVAGKPGEARTLEEKAELMEKQRKEREKKERGLVLPRSVEKTPGLKGFFSKLKAKKGTKELGKRVMG